MFANWARAKNDVRSRFWTWKIFAKIAEMDKISKIAENEIDFSKRSKFGSFWKK